MNQNQMAVYFPFFLRFTVLEIHGVMEWSGTELVVNIGLCLPS